MLGSAARFLLIAALLGCGCSGSGASNIAVPRIAAGTYNGTVTMTQGGSSWDVQYVLVVEQSDSLRVSFSDDGGRTGTITGTPGADGFDIVGDIDGSGTWQQVAIAAGEFNGTLAPRDPDRLLFVASGADPGGAFDLSGLLDRTSWAGALEIHEVWSDQFAGSRANRLPDQAGAQSGYMLVGARADGSVHVKARVQFATVVRDALHVRLARKVGEQFVAAGTSALHGEVALLSIDDDATPGVTDCYVIAWIDADGDGERDPATENLVAFPNPIRPIFQRHYDDAFASLQLLLLAEFLFPTAAAFLRGFLQNSDLEVAGEVFPYDLVHADSLNSRDHHVGVDFSPAGGGFVRRYELPASSKFSARIARSAATSWNLEQVIAGHRTKIRKRAFDERSDVEFSFDEPVAGVFDFLRDDRLDDDLGRTFNAVAANGRIKFTAVRDGCRLLVRSATFTGSIDDLYDWNYEEGSNRDGAVIQAGYGTLGTGGHIFAVHIDMDHDVAVDLDLADPAADCTINDMIVRNLVSQETGADQTKGNYWRRLDRFTNTSSTDSIQITGITATVGNPEDFGFPDVEPGNAVSIWRQIRSAHPELPFVGLSFWQLPGGNPALNVPPVTWNTAEFPGLGLPITLAAGESFELTTVVHNTNLGPADPQPADVGELVVGWKLTGN